VRKELSTLNGALATSTAAFEGPQNDRLQIGHAAYLKIGHLAVNLSNYCTYCTQYGVNRVSVRSNYRISY
jgi:hypothetical protein